MGISLAGVREQNAWGIPQPVGEGLKKGKIRGSLMSFRSRPEPREILSGGESLADTITITAALGL